MTRTVTPGQDTLLREPVTRPVFLVELLFGDQEYLSTNGDVTIDELLYVDYDVSLENIDDWKQARIRLQPTNERSQQFHSQQWRGAPCRVYLRPTVYYPQLLDPGYVEEGYAIEGTFGETPILLVDGLLTSGEKTSQAVIYTVDNAVTVGRWLPGVRLSSPTFNHLPRAGTVFTWEGERFTLEAR